jgi:hypothetical protein
MLTRAFLITLLFILVGCNIDQPIQSPSAITNDLPPFSVSPIPTISVAEDNSSGNIPFTVQTNSNAYCNSIVAASSSNTGLVSSGGIQISGRAPACFIRLTPNANAFGFSNITMTVNDIMGTETQNFFFIVNSVNDAPVMTTIPHLTVDIGTAIAPISFSISDVDSSLSCLTSVTRESSNQSMIPLSGVVITQVSPNNCLLTLTPAVGASGIGVITLRVSDGVNTTIQRFDVFINDAPIIADIPNMSTPEDSFKVFSIFIYDLGSPIHCHSSVTVTSSDQSILPNSAITISGTAPSCLITMTPTANAFGVVTVTVFVTDGSLTNSKNFTFTVDSVNDLPSLSPISNISAQIGATVPDATFTIADIETPLTCSGSVTATSSNQTLMPDGGLTVGGAAPNCTLSFTPASNQYGLADITVTLDDGEDTVTRTFQLAIFPYTVATIFPSGLAPALTVDQAGRLLIFRNNYLRIYDVNGVLISQIGSGTAGYVDGDATTASFSNPRGVAVDSANDLIYFTDGHAIRRIDSNGDVITLAGDFSQSGAVDDVGLDARFDNPRGLAIDLNGNVIVADYLNNAIRVVDPAGNVTTLAGTLGSAPGSQDGVGASAGFFGPSGVAVDPAGSIYVSDSNNHTIRSIDPNSFAVTTMAGDASSGGGHMDGGSAVARFNTPQGISLAPNGDLLIADINSQSLRRMTPMGVVSTYTGIPGTVGITDGPLDVATFSAIENVAAAPNGIIFIIDGQSLRFIDVP